MTHIAGGSRRGVPKVWILPVLALVMILIAISLGILSRSVLVDLIAWWPVWLVLVVLAFLSRGRRWGRVRVSALVAILSVLVLGAFITGHILGWTAMPSAATVLNGPQAGSVYDRCPIRPDRRSARGRVGPIGLPLRRRAGATWRGNRTAGQRTSNSRGPTSQSPSSPRPTRACTRSPGGSWISTRRRCGASPWLERSKRI